MKGVWKLPINYSSVPIVQGVTAHRYRISYRGRDQMVLVKSDTVEVGLGSATTIDVTGKWIKIAPNGAPRSYSLSGEYEALD